MAKENVYDYTYDHIVTQKGNMSVVDIMAMYGITHPTHVAVVVSELSSTSLQQYLLDCLNDYEFNDRDAQACVDDFIKIATDPSILEKTVPVYETDVFMHPLTRNHIINLIIRRMQYAHNLPNWYLEKYHDKLIRIAEKKVPYVVAKVIDTAFTPDEGYYICEYLSETGIDTLEEMEIILNNSHVAYQCKDVWDYYEVVKDVHKTSKPPKPKK